MEAAQIGKGLFSFRRRFEIPAPHPYSVSITIEPRPAGGRAPYNGHTDFRVTREMALGALNPWTMVDAKIKNATKAHNRPASANSASLRA